MKNNLTLIYDLDETLCTKKLAHESYSDVKPIQPIIDQLNNFYNQGHTIIISTARNMLTQNGDIGKILANVGPDTFEWLKKYGVRYHSIYFAKPYGDIYIDDKSCLNDPEEIQRRLDAIEAGTEKWYLAEYMNLTNRVKELEKQVKQLKQDKMWMKDE